MGVSAATCRLTSALNASRLCSVATDSGREFHWTIARGKKEYLY